MIHSTDGKQRVLSLSYGKDSMACLGAIEALGWPLDRIVTADVWATDNILADLPPMAEFKTYADRVIVKRYGIEVEHYEAVKDGKRYTFNALFYHQRVRGNYVGAIAGFPRVGGCEAQSALKMAAINRALQSAKGAVQYIGIAADEQARLLKLGDNKLSPLAAVGWAERDAWNWCQAHKLLSPTYTNWTRGGCWFCPCQKTASLRELRKQYPDLWALLLKWDDDTPPHACFKANGKSVHDYDRRFALEDKGLLMPGESFRWSMIDEFTKLRDRRSSHEGIH